MKFTDTLSGALAIVLGAAVAAYASSFPAASGQAIGPGRFPTIIGVGFMVLGVVLAVSGIRRGERLAIHVEDWMRRPRMVLNGVLVPVALIFYAAMVERVGFLLTSIAFLSLLCTAFGVRRILIVPIAVVATLVLHFCFYSLLRVPLPWGVLEGIAW